MSVSRQRAFCTVSTNSCALYSIRTNSDLSAISFERRQFLAKAVRASAFIVAALSSGIKEKHPRYGDHFYCVWAAARIPRNAQEQRPSDRTDMAGISSARYLVRMTILLPEVCDLYQVSYNLDTLILKLSDCASLLLLGSTGRPRAARPGHAPPVPSPPPDTPVPLTEMLRLTLARARRQGSLPYTPISQAAEDQPHDPPLQTVAGYPNGVAKQFLWDSSPESVAGEKPPAVLLEDGGVMVSRGRAAGRPLTEQDPRYLPVTDGDPESAADIDAFGLLPPYGELSGWFTNAWLPTGPQF